MNENIKIGIWTAVLLTLGLCACSIVEEYDLDYDGDKLVVNGFLVNNQRLSVQISRSQAPTGEVSKDIEVRGAKVILYQDKEPIAELLEIGKGIYRTEYIPSPQVDYRLEVEATDFPKLSSSPERMPNSFPLKSFSYSKKESTAFNSNPGFEVKIELKDPPKNRDFYEFSVRGFHPRSGFVKQSTLIGGDADFGNLPCTFSSDNQSVILEDACFDGAVYTMRFEFEESNTIVINGQIEEIKLEKFVVSLRKVSESYYRYRQTSKIPEGIDYAFFEPRMLFSNIEGGYGIFGSWNETNIEIQNR